MSAISSFRDYDRPLLPVPEVELPAANGLCVAETIACLFRDERDLRERLAGPLSIDADLCEKMVQKLKPLVGKFSYPSQIAQLLFEIAFVDQTITPSQRTANMGYVLHNLGSGNGDLIQRLDSFYYRYSFQHFAPK